MLVTLAKNATTDANLSKAIVSTLAGILSGTITTTAQLNSTYFTSASSSFVLGSYDLPTYWTIENDSTSSSSSGSITLSCNSRLGSTRKNCLKISYTDVAISFFVGSSIASGALVNPVEVTLNNNAWAQSNISNWANANICVRFADGFVHIWSPTYMGRGTSGPSYWTSSWMFLGVEISDSDYYHYSLEGTFKGFAFGSQAGNGYVYVFPSGSSLPLKVAAFVSNYMAPNTEVYSASKTWTNLYNSFLPSYSSNVQTTRNANTVDLLPSICNIVMNRHNEGWLGADLSELTGLYFTSYTSFIHDDLVTLGLIRYKVYNPPSTMLYNTAFLAKI